MTDDAEVKLMEAERKRFEAWARFKRADFERHPKLPERYVSVTTQTYWVGWIARAGLDYAAPTGESRDS